MATVSSKAAAKDKQQILVGVVMATTILHESSVRVVKELRAEEINGRLVGLQP